MTPFAARSALIKGLGLPDTDVDAQHLTSLRAVEPHPHFIIGLHRSGTTVVYKTLVQNFHLAALRIYDIVFYRTLLQARQRGTEAQLRQRLQRYFAAHRLRTRVVDNIELSPDTVEEYGWLLRQHAGSLRLTQRCRAVFEQMCRKLQLGCPGAHATLLKNPWDTRNAPAIAAMFPTAKFIFVRRDPLAILNSQFRNSLHYGRDADPFLDLLIHPLPVERTLVAGQRLLYRVAGKRRYGKLLLKHLEVDVARELEHYAASWAAVESHRKIEVSHETFVAEPARAVGTLATFLNLPPASERMRLPPTARASDTLPEVAARSRPFLAALRH